MKSRSLERVLNPNTDEAEAIAFVEALFQRYGVETHCLKVAQDYADRAKAALTDLPETPACIAWRNCRLRRLTRVMRNGYQVFLRISCRSH